MDLALAIWQIDPTAEYRLTSDKTAILEWRGPGPEPTADDLAAAWTTYQAAHPTPASDTTDTDVQAVLGIVTDPDAQAALRRILTRALGQTG